MSPAPAAPALAATPASAPAFASTSATAAAVAVSFAFLFQLHKILKQALLMTMRIIESLPILVAKVPPSLFEAFGLSLSPLHLVSKGLLGGSFISIFGFRPLCIRTARLASFAFL